MPTHKKQKKEQYYNNKTELIGKYLEKNRMEKQQIFQP